MRWLSSWKANSLSLAGRLTLSKSVVGALPFYAVQSIFFPAIVCDDINKVKQNFIWVSKKIMVKGLALALDNHPIYTPYTRNIYPKNIPVISPIHGCHLYPRFGYKICTANKGINHNKLVS